METEEKRISARVTKTLYDRVCAQCDNVSQAVIAGLELWVTALENGQPENMSEYYKGMTEVLQMQSEFQQEQLAIKDLQIDKLNDVMHKQAVHIQSLINDNSGLTQKLLTAPKKTWWKFW